MAQVWDLREEEGIELAADLESQLCDNGPAILDELLEWPPVRDIVEIVSVFPRTKNFFKKINNGYLEFAKGPFEETHFSIRVFSKK